MAKVRSPLHSIDLRGRIADGFVFTVWRGINCLRTFVMPSQPRTQRKEQIWKTVSAPIRTGPKKSCGIITTKEVQNACQQVVTREAV